MEIIEGFWAPDEVEEIWLTFSDPQMKKVRKRLTSTHFMERYRRFLIDGGLIHLKTDSNFLYTYTRLMAEHNKLPIVFATEDLYNRGIAEGEAEERTFPAMAMDDATRSILSIRTYYESQWIERGLNIKYLKFRLPHAAALTESDIEIPIDDYRSFRRNSRSGVETRK